LLYRLNVISSMVSRASAILLLVGGLALLFAPDALLPALVPDFPRGPAAALAVVYGALLLRGPFDSLQSPTA
jgi:peptidoglycan/LPS O-acetylase OafA/YrhL